MRHLTNEPLFVDPALAGAGLASPTRRILAIAVDAVALVIPTIVVAVAAAFVSLQVRDPRAARAVAVLVEHSVASTPGTATTGQATAAASGEVQEAFRDLVPLLVETEAKGLPAAVTVAVEEGDLNRAADLLKDRHITIQLYLGEGRNEKALGPNEVRFEVKELIPPWARAAALFGVPALYFAIFTRSRRGATPGKRLLGIRVARLDGERLTLLESLERFLGYLHIPGTLFVSLLDLWRDPNRRLPHDRVAHTAVFRVRRRDVFPPAQIAR